MIGKGPRNDEVKKAIIKYKAVYFTTISGAGNLSFKICKKSRYIFYYQNKLYLENFPAIVSFDIYGKDLYER